MSGLNTGVASAHNVAWKVGAVAAGWAGDALLDTYEEERRPTAQRNVDYSAGRGEGMLRMAEAVRAGDLDTVRRGIAARGSLGTRQGMDLGYTYTSASIIPDGSELPAVEDPVRDYVQNARPGSRAPHLWIGDGRSTLDLFGGGMVVISGADGEDWVRAARADRQRHSAVRPRARDTRSLRGAVRDRARRCRPRPARRLRGMADPRRPGGSGGGPAGRAGGDAAARPVSGATGAVRPGTRPRRAARPRNSRWRLCSGLVSRATCALSR